ncbi:MAG: LysE family transporter, partial [Candidatus Poseidoniia archaeon]
SVLITDGPIILLMALAWNSLKAYENWLSAAAAILLLWLSWKAFNTKAPMISETQEVEHSLRNGVMTNLVNPNPYRFWGLVGAPFLVAAWALNPWAPALFICGFFSVFIIAKVFIAVTVHRSREFLQSRGYLIVMRTCGVGLLLFAIGFGLRLT